MSVDSNPRTAEQILNEIIVLIKQGSPNAIEQIARLILEYKQQSEWDRL
jgi:predicted nucleic acid-binding protein